MPARHDTHAAIIDAARCAYAVLAEPEADTDYGRASQQLRRLAAAKVLRERLDNLGSLTESGTGSD